MGNRICRVLTGALMLIGSAHAFTKDTLFVGESMSSGESLQSANSSYRFFLQGDGNLVLRNSAGSSLWASGTNGRGGTRLSMQSDGNLVLYTTGGSAVWATGTNGKGANRAVLQDSGNLVLNTANNSTVWATNTGQGDGGGTAGKITHIGTTQVWDSDGQNVRINRPANTQAGDLLVLAIHRTDDTLPDALSGWTRRAECYKEDNGYQCVTIANCTSRSGSFCTRFSSRYTGRDLAQVMYTRTASANEASSYAFNFNQDSTGHPGWAILSTLRGANTISPVRAWANKGCDGDVDSLFPSVDGRKGDMLLLSQSFDDAVSQDRFGAPSEMSTFGYVSNSDEAGFLYGGILNADGPTGVRRTTGSGASSCKDALISLTIRPK